MRKLLVLFGAIMFAVSDASAQSEGFGFQTLKEKFIEGDWFFMSFVLICLILGLAFCIERIITLNIATTNTDALLSKIDERLADGDMEGAKEVCRATPGPTASVLLEGLNNSGGGPEAVEKAIVSYGSVQMGLLEKGLVWISLFIAIAPMLGFMGTVIGMIIVSKVDGIVNKMEDASIGLVEMMNRNNTFGRS